MNVWAKPYRRRDGVFMIYLNNDRGVSLAISPDRGYQSSKATPGQQKLWAAFCNAVRACATPVATGADMARHDEEFFTMFNGIGFALTDVATVGGVSTGADGLFVTLDGAVFGPRFADV